MLVYIVILFGVGVGIGIGVETQSLFTVDFEVSGVKTIPMPTPSDLQINFWDSC